MADHSFHYGDDSGSTPFVRLLSTTPIDSMLSVFREHRWASLSRLPPEARPIDVVNWDIALAAGNATTCANPSPQGRFVVSGAFASDDPNSDGSSGGDSWGKKQGIVVFALIGVNMITTLGLVAVTTTLCIRGRRRHARYTPPVHFKEMIDDSEGTYLRYSDRGL